MKKALKRSKTAIIGMHDGLRGDASGLRGNVSLLRGNVDTCGLTAAERSAGVNVADLVEEA